MSFDKKVRTFGRLKEKIKEKFKTQKLFAESLGINVATLNLKLNGKVEWTLAEIEKTCLLLDLAIHEIPVYFFY